jgi:hypothetical protein
VTGQEREAARPLTYQDAGSQYDVVTARKRYEALTNRDMYARTAAKLRERGEFDPGNPGHRLIAEAEPLSAVDHLELMSLGELLARYFRHPAMLHHAVAAGATWEQIGAARGTDAGQARSDYRDWAAGQHNLYRDLGRLGMDDADYDEALRQVDAPEPTPAHARQMEAGQ